MVKMELFLALLPVELLGVIDEQWPLCTLAQKVQPSSSTVKTLEADTVQPSPGCAVNDQPLSETNSLESLPPPSDDDLLSNLNWMHHPAEEVHPQVNVIGSSSKPPTTLKTPIYLLSYRIMKTSLMRLFFLQCHTLCSVKPLLGAAKEGTSRDGTTWSNLTT